MKKSSQFSVSRLAYALVPAVIPLSRAFSIPASGLIEKSGVYLHIPFCRRRCHYCDFPIKVIGDKPSARTSSGEYYTDLLIKDIKHWSNQNSAEGRLIDTVYFGGGTPSLLPDDCVGRIMDQLRQTFELSPQAEVTLEMDPGTFTHERLHTLRATGINRISMGVQSFDNAMLRHCGRPHNVQDTIRALDDLHRANWENFSIDLISSLPHLTPVLWEQTLQAAVDAGSAHISVYDLQVEPKTAFARWYTPGTFPLPTEEVSAEMYSTAVRTLTQGGFEHYEVSNYAKPGRRSRHNQKYWSCAPVYAFGMSAASYVHGERFSRPKNMKEYEQYVQTLAAGIDTGTVGIQEGNNEGNRIHVVSTVESEHTPSLPDMLEVIMLSLRTADGLHLPQFASLYGTTAADQVVRVLTPYAVRGLVEFRTTGGMHISAPPGAVASGSCTSSGSGDGGEYSIPVHILSMTSDSGGSLVSVDSNTSSASTSGKIDSSPASGSDNSSGNKVVSVRLADPRGFLLSNEVISSVFAAFPN